MASGINERTWLEWLVKVRVIIITILLAIELAIVNLTTTHVNRRVFVLVILAWYAMAGLHLFLFTYRKRDWRFQSKLQVVSDLIFATAVFYVTGGMDTSFALSLSIYHHCRQHPALGNLGLSHRRPLLYPLRRDS